MTPRESYHDEISARERALRQDDEPIAQTLLEAYEKVFTGAPDQDEAGSPVIQQRLGALRLVSATLTQPRCPFCEFLLAPDGYCVRDRMTPKVRLGVRDREESQRLGSGPDNDVPARKVKLYVYLDRLHDDAMPTQDIAEQVWQKLRQLSEDEGQRENVLNVLDEGQAASNFLGLWGQTREEQREKVRQVAQRTLDLLWSNDNIHMFTIESTASDRDRGEESEAVSKLRVGSHMFFKGKETFTRLLPFAITAAALAIFGPEATPIPLALAPLPLTSPDAIATLRTIIQKLSDEEVLVLDTISAWTRQPRRLGWNIDGTEIIGNRGPTTDELAEALESNLAKQELLETLLVLSKPPREVLEQQRAHGYWQIKF